MRHPLTLHGLEMEPPITPKTPNAVRPLVYEQLTGIIRQTAFEVRCYFGPGFLEKVYKNALVNRLRKKGLHVDPRRHLAVHDEDGAVVGEYEPDLVVEERVIVELKAVRALDNNHRAQLANYLKATGARAWLLVNFGAERLQVKRHIHGTADSVSSACSVVPSSLVLQRRETYRP